MLVLQPQQHCLGEQLLERQSSYPTVLMASAGEHGCACDPGVQPAADSVHLHSFICRGFTPSMLQIDIAQPSRYCTVSCNTDLATCCRCTWDAFYSTVSARGLLEGLDSLATGGVSPQLLIIDDGWQVGWGMVIHYAYE